MGQKLLPAHSPILHLNGGRGVAGNTISISTYSLTTQHNITPFLTPGFPRLRDVIGHTMQIYPKLKLSHTLTFIYRNIYLCECLLGSRAAGNLLAKWVTGVRRPTQKSLVFNMSNGAPIKAVAKQRDWRHQ